MEAKLEKKEMKLQNRLDKLTAKGRDTGDLGARISQLRQSRTDFSDMRRSSTEFRFASLGNKFNQARDRNGNGLPQLQGLAITK
jgi:hypothetical protein